MKSVCSPAARSACCGGSGSETIGPIGAQPWPPPGAWVEPTRAPGSGQPQPGPSPSAVRRIPSRPGRSPFPRDDPLPAMPALTDALDISVALAGVSHGQVRAAAFRARQAARLLRVIATSCVPLRHRLPLCNSERRMRPRATGFVSVPNSTAPSIDAATAQPTRQSSQWLSG